MLIRNLSSARTLLIVACVFCASPTVASEYTLSQIDLKPNLEITATVRGREINYIIEWTNAPCGSAYTANYSRSTDGRFCRPVDEKQATTHAVGKLGKLVELCEYMDEETAVRACRCPDAALHGSLEDPATVRRKSSSKCSVALASGSGYEVGAIPWTHTKDQEAGKQQYATLRSARDGLWKALTEARRVAAQFNGAN